MEIRRIRMAMTSPFIENMGTMIPGNMGGGGEEAKKIKGRGGGESRRLRCEPVLRRVTPRVEGVD